MKRFATDLTEAERSTLLEAFGACCPRVIPAGWNPIHGMGDFWNCRWLQSTDGLRICFEVEYVDTSLWIHVSFSRRERDPNYFDMTRVKELFIGADRKAIMVLPAQAEHYNFAKHCLHFYSPLDSDPLPDFRGPGGAL